MVLVAYAMFQLNTVLYAVSMVYQCCIYGVDGEDQPLTVHTDMVLVAYAMCRPDSGLEIRDRLWLKITIPRAFIGVYLWSVVYLWCVCGLW